MSAVAELPFRPLLVGARPIQEVRQLVTRPIPPAAAESAVVESQPFPTLADAMRTHIGEALRRTAGQIEGAGGAAALLGLNPHTLRGKMRKLRIDWASYRTVST